MNFTSIQKILGVFLLLFLGLGISGIYERLTEGHSSANYGSYVIWGLWVSAYIYFIGLSAGAFLLSSLIYVFGVKKLEPIGKLSLFVALITLLMALLSIWMDLGRMERFYLVFTRPNFSSMMAWMIWLYSAYFFLLSAEMWFAIRPDLARQSTQKGMRGWIARQISFSRAPLTPLQEKKMGKWLKTLSAFGIPLAIAFHGGVGALFGTISARAYWHTPLVPILFLTGALVSGGALMSFLLVAFWPNRDKKFQEMVSLMARILLILLALDVMLEWAEFSIPMWYGITSEYHLLTQVLYGPYWWVFWIVHGLLGTLLPLSLLIFKRNQAWAIGTAGFLVAVTFMAVRLNIVIPGLVEPNLQLLQNAFRDHRLQFSYFPSFFEWKVSFLILAIGSTFFYLGYRYLPLIEERKLS